MKKSNLLKVSALVATSLFLASCGSNLLSSATGAATTAATDAAKNYLSSVDTGALVAKAGSYYNKLSPSNKQLLQKVATGALSNPKLQALLQQTGVDSYVKNAASLVLAKNLLGEGNADLAQKALGYFDKGVADSTQNSLFSSLTSFLK